MAADEISSDGVSALAKTVQVVMAAQIAVVMTRSAERCERFFTFSSLRAEKRSLTTAKWTVFGFWVVLCRKPVFDASLVNGFRHLREPVPKTGR
ncbi:hypothetical protein [Bifidobacterium sp. ESL0790]|uniref:hypothetical protein n=1 Tax=Bifidobacterium sp. ESL0790 TaxID=2983233 RepID=UPI0023F71631|nr:hypothetical protein [Bifidobacterium sp. ESL0790]WEV72394.1 hypothetical protein OZY47_08260 [Bifidobacterium sp. ESL0790]